MWIFAALIALTSCGFAIGQSNNYEKQAPTITLDSDEEGFLPVFGTLNGSVTELDTLPSTIVLKKTKAVLNCSSGYMKVGMIFDKPFYGIVYGDHDRHSACKITGDGQREAEIRLPLKGCGTLQSPARVFTNNIVVRFHPSFEIAGDEVITIICRYPPPIVPPPAVPGPLILPAPNEVRSLAPLREFEILLIICAIIFLALLLLGIGCSYYCLKKRNIKVVKRRPASTLGSEITKISEPISMFGGLKIPRAHAEDTSGSEEMTESVRSEFQSDIISTASEDDITSAYSDAPFELPEGAVFAQLHAPPRPGFDIRTKINKEMAAFSDVESNATSESELVLMAQEQYLTTILERTDTTTLETLERIRRAEAQAGPPPVHARVRVVNRAGVSDHSELESESEYSQVSDYYHDKLRLATSEQTNFTLGLQDAALIKRIQEEEAERTDKKVKQERRKLEEEILNQRRETITTSTRDHYRTEKEQQIGYQQEQHQQYAHQEHHQQQQEQHQQYAHQGHHQQQQEQHQQYAHQEHHQHQHQHQHQQQQQQQQQHHQHQQQTNQSAQDLITPVILERATANMRVSPPRNNFDVLIRILEEPEYFAGEDNDDVSSVLTEEERYRLREVIMTDERIQTILKETHTTEKMLMLKDYRKIEQVIHPQKWDVLIRIIDNADAASLRRSGGDDTSITTYGGGRKTAASSMTAQEMRSMSEVMVDYGYSEQHQETRSGYSGRSSTFTQAVSSTADRSGTEMMETDHYISAEAYYEAGGAASTSYSEQRH